MTWREAECYRRWQSYESNLFPALARVPERNQEGYARSLTPGQRRNLLDELEQAYAFDRRGSPVLPAHINHKHLREILERSMRGEASAA